MVDLNERCHTCGVAIWYNTTLKKWVANYVDKTTSWRCFTVDPSFMSLGQHLPKRSTDADRG